MELLAKTFVTAGRNVKVFLYASALPFSVAYVFNRVGVHGEGSALAALASFVVGMVAYGVYAVSCCRIVVFKITPESLGIGAGLGSRELRFMGYGFSLMVLWVAAVWILASLVGSKGPEPGGADMLILLILSIPVTLFTMRLSLILPAAAVDGPGNLISNMKTSWRVTGKSLWALFGTHMAINLVMLFALNPIIVLSVTLFSLDGQPPEVLLQHPIVAASLLFLSFVGIALIFTMLSLAHIRLMPKPGVTLDEEV